jgi:hypothetical protein
MSGMGIKGGKRSRCGSKPHLERVGNCRVMSRGLRLRSCPHVSVNPGFGSNFELTGTLPTVRTAA